MGSGDRNDRCGYRPRQWPQMRMTARRSSINARPAIRSIRTPSARTSVASSAVRRDPSTDLHYSDALKKSGITWDEATLDKWLQGPSKDVPGTQMIFAGIKDEGDRANLIAYLKTLK